MEEILRKIAFCLERGKVNTNSPYPPDLAGQEGVDELTRRALNEGYQAERILTDALVVGMDRVGERFHSKEIFLPDVLMAAKAMHAGMAHLEQFFSSGEVRHKGVVLMGTVTGDLHDIGKKIVGMFFEGGGWRVIDLGVDVDASRFILAVESHKPIAVGLSALLTTTMSSMGNITQELKSASPHIRVIVGGAPVTKNFAGDIGADAYSPDPQGALEYLNRSCS